MQRGSGWSSASFSSLGGVGAPITVKTTADCGWTATTAAQWIVVTSVPTGTGNGVVAYLVQPNTGAARTGTIDIGSAVFTVSQAAPCSYSIDPTSATFDKDKATSAPVSVTAPAGCAWTAISNDSWITVTSGGVYYRMDSANPGWREFFLARVVESQNLNGWSALFLDNVEGGLGKYYGLKPARYPDNASYQNAIAGFRIRAQAPSPECRTTTNDR